MPKSKIFGSFGLVAKVNVSDLEASVSWYVDHLGFVRDSRFDVPNVWAQVTDPELANTAIGLNVDASGVGTGGARITFVVPNIVDARDALIATGVSVGPILDVGNGVQMAEFEDPDKNSLALRQNHEDMPALW